MAAHPRQEGRHEALRRKVTGGAWPPSAIVARDRAAPLPRPPGDSPLRYRDASSPTVTVTQRPPVRQRPRANGNPVALRLDLYPPHRRHARRSRPGARVGARRRLQRRRQGQRRARRRGQHVRQARLRGRVDQLPPARQRVRRPTRRARLHRSRRSRPSTTPRPRCDGCARTRRPTASTRPGSASAASPPAASPRRWWASTPRTSAAAATPASRRPCAASCRSRAGCPAALFASAGDALGLLLPRHRRRRRAVELVATHDRREDAAARACPPGSSTSRAPATCRGRSTARSTSSRRTTSSTSRSTWRTRPASRRPRRAPPSGSWSAWPRARRRSGCSKRHPKLKRLEKRARRLAR